MDLKLGQLLRQYFARVVRYVERHPQLQKRLKLVARSIPALDYKLRSALNAHRLSLSSFGPETRASDVTLDSSVEQARNSEGLVLPLPKGKRSIYLYVDYTVQAAIGARTDWVTRMVASSLVKCGERVRYVKWDASAQRCLLINSEERKHLALAGGPTVQPEESDIYLAPGIPSTSVSRCAPSENHWLVVPEITYVATNGRPVTLDLLLWGRQTGLKSGFVFYDAIPLRCEELDSRALSQAQYMKQLLLADVVWPISESSAKDLLSFWAERECVDERTQPEVQTVSLPVGFKSVQRVRTCEAADPLILSVGLTEFCNHPVQLIRAFEQHQNENPQSKWRLCLVGELSAEVEGELNRAMMSGLTIQHLRQVSDQKLEALYRSCAFTIAIPTSDEFGLPILESLWFGKPSICADSEAMAEIAAGGGCLTVTMQRLDSFASGLARLIEDDDFRLLLANQALNRPIKTGQAYAREICARFDFESQPAARLGQVFYWIDLELQSDGKNTEAQRVSRQLAKVLLSLGVYLIPVKWNSSARQFQHASGPELAVFSGWDGPDASAWCEWIAPADAKPSSWFFMSDLPLVLALTERSAMISFARKSKLHCAAVFCDAAPSNMGAIYPPHFSEVYRDYMVELDQYDLVLPATLKSRSDLVSFLGAALLKPQSLDAKIKLVSVPGEFPQSTGISDSTMRNDGSVMMVDETIHRGVKSWRDYGQEVAMRLAEVAKAKPMKSLYVDPAEVKDRVARMRLQVRPKLSVCISTYNRAEWLATSLKNWALQYPVAHHDVELLVCDNTSTDRTAEVVKPYCVRQDFSYHCNPKNVGMLGNLRETANHARGEYIWILGDDDLLLPGALASVLGAIHTHPRVALVYLNYAFTRLEDARTITNFEAFFRDASPIIPSEADRSGPIREICARNENFFTAIYTLVFRRDHALRAYSQDTSGRPFSTMPTCIPTTTYVLNHMMEEPGVWIGAPQLVVNMNVSWLKYAPLWILERIPEVYEVAEQKGVAAKDVDRWRRHSLPGIAHYFREIFSSDPLNNAAYFCASRLVRRFKHLPEFAVIAPTLQAVYLRAHTSGHPAAKLPVDRVFPQAASV